MAADLAVIVTARNEAERLGATLRALPEADVWVADDASEDATAAVAERAGARVVTAPKRLGKGGAATLAAEALLREGDPVVLLADADLGASARELRRLVEALGPLGPDAELVADLAIASFARRTGGGFGVAVGSARWAIRRATGHTMQAPISGQRAMRPGVLRQLLPFADGFGMETGMTIDALRAGLRLVEVELDLEHRATGRTLGGFVHRGRQAKDILRAYASRRP
ncbi:MAG TPA: glycosyltransferase [Thermoleophilaceae bacterium]|nr:glycosyltransferase [Thermoleophilaceae bacterium]